MEYIPHLFLAQCAFRNGDIRAAASYLKEAESSGAASSSRASQFAELRRNVDARLQEAKTPPKPAQTVPPPVPTQKEPVVVPPPKPVPESKPPEIKQPAQPQFDRQAAVNRALKEASDAYANGNYQASRDAATRVLGLDPGNTEAQRLLGQLVVKETEAAKNRERDGKMAEINRALRNHDFATAESQAIALKLQYPSDQSVLEIVERVQKQKESDLQKRTADEVRKTAEKQVMIAFYKGDYPTAVQLAQQGIDKNPDSWRLHFFLGCSYAALALLEEDNSEPRMDLAKESFRKARSVAGTISLPPYISPKILAIYRNS
jgi:hypothetical protein